MEIRTEEGYFPQAAIVFYRGALAPVLVFRYGKDGEATSVSLPSEEDVAELVGLMGERAKARMTYLHPRAVAWGLLGRAWWRPAWPAPLYFALPALEDLSGEVLPQPPLLFVERAGRLFVFALPEDRRPEPDTPLLLAPYPNLYRGGEVCLGTSRRGRDLEDWESAFFESAFSHVGDTVASREGGLSALWRRAKEEGRFPVEKLREAGRTLKEVLE